MKDNPIQDEYRDKMNQLAGMLDNYFNGEERPKTIAFALLISPFGDRPDGHVNYISNAERQDMVKMLKDYVARAEAVAGKEKP
jgi:hypothetical protein